MRSVGRGEVLVSLCWQPAAARLTVVLLKARNLPKMDVTGLADPLVLENKVLNTCTLRWQNKVINEHSKALVNNLAKLLFKIEVINTKSFIQHSFRKQIFAQNLLKMLFTPLHKHIVPQSCNCIPTYRTFAISTDIKSWHFVKLKQNYFTII